MIKIEVERKYIVKTKTNLIFNEKVVNFLYNQIQRCNNIKRKGKFHERLVFVNQDYDLYGEDIKNCYEEPTKELIKSIIEKGDFDERKLAYLDEDFQMPDKNDYNANEYLNLKDYNFSPFKVIHASPCNHRYEGDYDESAYDDWRIEKFTLFDIFYLGMDKNGELNNEKRLPYFFKYKDLFDFEEEIAEEEPTLCYANVNINEKRTLKESLQLQKDILEEMKRLNTGD